MCIYIYIYIYYPLYELYPLNGFKNCCYISILILYTYIYILMIFPLNSHSSFLGRAAVFCPGPRAGPPMRNWPWPRRTRSRPVPHELKLYFRNWVNDSYDFIICHMSFLKNGFNTVPQNLLDVWRFYCVSRTISFVKHTHLTPFQSCGGWETTNHTNCRN